MVGRLCCSNLSARKEPTHIEALSDEVLLNILEQASKREGHSMMRGTLPLVCKRWKGTIYDAKGDLRQRCTNFTFKEKGRPY